MKYFFVILSAQLCFGGIPEELWTQGNDAMIYERYDDAIQSYESLIELGYKQADVYYNLGNAYYRNHAIGQAIWAYSLAKKLSPRDGDVIHNLSISEAKKVDRIEMPKAFWLLEKYRNLKSGLTLNRWILIGSIFLFIQALWVFGMQFGWVNSKIGQPILSGVIITTLFTHGIALDKYFQEKRTNEGIVIANGVDAYSGPYYGENIVLFRINEGSKVDINQFQKDWIEIILIDGKKGWIPEESLRRLQ